MTAVSLKDPPPHHGFIKTETQDHIAQSTGTSSQIMSIQDSLFHWILFKTSQFTFLYRFPNLRESISCALYMPRDAGGVK